MPADMKASFYNVLNYDPATDAVNPDDPNAEAPVTGAAGSTKLVELRGLEYDDPMWDTLLDQPDR